MATTPQSSALEWRMFIVGCIMLLAAIAMAFWAFVQGTLTEDQRLIVLWILPLASGFGAGAFAGSVSVKARGVIPGLIVSATGGFGVWLLTYFLLPLPGDTPLSRATQERDTARHYFSLAEQPGGQSLPNLQQALAHYANAAREYRSIPGQEVEHLAAVGAQGLVSEKIAYLGAESGRIFALNEGAIVWSRSESGDAVSLDTPQLQRGNVRCTDVQSMQAWENARDHYLDAFTLLSAHFGTPSANTPLPVLRNARSAAYFFICDCLMHEVDNLDRAEDALSIVMQATNITNLNIEGRFQDAVAKLEFVDALSARGCRNLSADDFDSVMWQSYPSSLLS